MYVALIVYFVIALVVVGLARIVVDPYQHFSGWSDWLQAIGIGLFWLPCLLYGVALLVCHHFWGEYD